jgi:FixJ family two-component response regulator
MSGAGEKPVVYVVDDDASFRRGVSRLLALSGHEVRGFASGSEFLALHESAARGCLIVDLKMPGVSGMELQAALVRAGSALPVIFLTGHGDIPTSVHAIKGGAEDFLTKPVQKDALLAAVARAVARNGEELERRGSEAELRQRFARLSPREREVLDQVLAGRMNKEIAVVLGAGERTIKAHRAQIMQKTGAQSPADLGRMAQAAGVSAGNGTKGQ